MDLAAEYQRSAKELDEERNSTLSSAERLEALFSHFKEVVAHYVDTIRHQQLTTEETHVLDAELNAALAYMQFGIRFRLEKSVFTPPEVDIMYSHGKLRLDTVLGAYQNPISLVNILMNDEF